MEFDFSGSTLLSKGQKRFVLYFALSSILLLLFFHKTFIFSILIVYNVLGILVVSFKLWIFVQGSRLQDQTSATNHSPLTISNEADLPSYTIIVPAYKEVNIVTNLIWALKRLNYPQSKLQILLVLEEDDGLTLDALSDITLPPHFQIIVVPHSFPKTKPKACNYALGYATGEIISVYDADDAPHPSQLRLVAEAFRTANQNMMCIQCKLTFYNSHDSTLSILFELEYRILFDYILPVASLYKWPIPLGGSSNHIRHIFLKKQGWNPYNVTEDAELGMRAALLGYNTKVLHSYTYEEVPFAILPWLKQRSRWLKGYLITSLMYMRYKIPPHSSKGAICFALYIMLLSPIMIAITLPMIILSISIWTKFLALTTYQGYIVNVLAFINLTIFSLSLLYMSEIANAHNKQNRFGRKWTWFPAYMILHSVASIIAICELFIRPYHWNKTEHGLARTMQIFDED